MTKLSLFGLPADVLAALRALDELVIEVELNSDDTDSVEVAIGEVEARIDAAVAAYPDHPWIDSTVAELKTQCRESLMNHTTKVRAPAEIHVSKKSTLH